MSTIRCDIVSAEEEIFHGSAQMIVATGEMGELGIAPRHAPLITRLKPGQVRVILENASVRPRSYRPGSCHVLFSHCLYPKMLESWYDALTVGAAFGF